MRRKRMIKRILTYIIVFILTYMNCYVPDAFAASNKDNDKNKTQEVVKAKKHRSNQRTDIIVKYKNNGKKDKIVKDIKTKTKSGKFNQKRYFKQQNITVYEINETDNLDSVIEELNKDPNVEYAQPNYPLEVAAVPTDDKFENQWALYNDGQEVDGYPGRATVDINVLNAWNLTMGDEEVVIGVLDTGVDIKHPDLSDNIYVNTEEIPKNNIDDDGNGYIDDLNGWDFSNDDSSVFDTAAADTHGTYVAGVIAARGNNGGIVGVAPKVKIVPLKFIHGTIGYTSDAIEAIEYAMNMGVKVVNCSFGGTDNNQALKDAMEQSGILFICSAGNRGSDTLEKPVYPAAFDINNILSVAAIDRTGVLPNFTSYGENVDVAAPGTNILSTIPGEDSDYSDNFDYYSGTSVSAAVVSGIAALIQSNLPNDSVSEIKSRIINSVVVSSALRGKIASDGRVDAFAALSGTIQPEDDYVGEGQNGDVLPVEGDGETDTWYVMDERASNTERFHYGEGGVNPASGNYSVSCTDMSNTAPGFSVEISRSYNSRNQRQTLLGRGWTFGFEGRMIEKDDMVELSLPNGSSQVMHFKDGKYIGEGTRATFVRNVNDGGVDILTTQDQYKYGFDSVSHNLIYMEDRNSNRVNLTYENSKLTTITDTVGRVYTLSYNEKGLLSHVTDPLGRKVTYDYNEDNLLIKVTDPEGGSLTYQYDESQYLTKLIDQNGHTFQQLTYNHNPGDAQNKVSETTDAAGETWIYSYDINNHNTTITNNENKKWTYWFDSAMYTTKVQDPEGRSTITEYIFNDINRYYGDVKASIDRNGNRTDFDVDLTTGNVTKITYPDGGIKNIKYDEWNNVIEEVNQSGNRTYYIYDSLGKKLLKKVQPLDGTSNYVEGNTTDFAVTAYEYYTKIEADSMFHCNVDGLQKSVTDPEGNVTNYTYNLYGDIASMKDPAGNVTTYTYNKVGQKLTETTPEGHKTEWNYDKNGLVIREIHPDGGVKRTVYDLAGYTLLEVNPKQYEADKDNTTTNTYTGTMGTHYEYYDNGYQKASVDAEDNRTEYTWDIFGNKQTEKKPNGAIYHYEYDSLNRLTKTCFRANESESEVLLNEFSYATLMNGNTQTTTFTYMDDTKKSTMVSIKDYAGREVELQYEDNSRTSVKYNLDGTINQTTEANGAITYYSYDALGNNTNVWKPMSVVDGNTLYSWTGYSYDKAGNLTDETAGKSLVLLNATTDDTYVRQYNYIDGQLENSTDSEGRNTSYVYNGDRRITKLTQNVSSSEKQVIEKTYNYLGKVTSVTKKVRAGDISGYSYDNNELINLTESYDYDLNGNLISETDAAGNVTKYTYDELNRNLKITKQLKDTQGEIISEVVTSKTYTWDGQVASEIDANGNTAHYTYDAQGNQTKIKDALGNITFKVYDRASNNTAIVSPKNYQEGATLKDMERTEFVYDPMGRVEKQIEVYQKMTLSSSYDWTKEWVNITSKTYQYDSLGNIISTTDALGNETKKIYNLSGMEEYEIDAETAAQGLPFTVSYSYNGLGQKVKETGEGAIYTYEYDGAGNLLYTKVNDVTRSVSAYDLLGRAISITDGRGNATTKKWNAFGKISMTTTPGDATIVANQITSQYDLLGNLVYTKDSTGAITTYTYDSLGRNLSKTVKNAGGEEKISTSATYDLNGNILTETDGNGNTTISTFDALNQKAALTNALGQKTTYTYDANGKLILQENYLGNKTKYLYDGINRLVETRDAYNNVIEQLIYNDADTQIYSYDALNNRTEFLYDRNMRQTGTIDAEGNTTTSVYDSRGNVSTRTDADGNTTTYQYDGENRLIKVSDPLGNSTSYTYDAAGNKVSQTDGNGNTATYQYNAANKLIGKIDPNGVVITGRTESYTYYANGRMASKTDRNSITTSYTYDFFGRLTEEDAGGEVQSYTYDANGNLLTMDDATGITYRTYDELNRNISKTVPDVGKSIYEYDLPAEEAGEYAERTTDPKGNATIKTYDKAARLSKVQVGEDTTVYEYNRNGSRYRVIYPDGTTETYHYDRKNQITSLVNAKADQSVISSYQYTYDPASNQLSKTEGKGTTTYTYDSLNRISTVSEPDGKVTTYTYDGAGNRKAEKVEKGLAGAVILYNYNEQNRLISTLASDGTETKFLYDRNGNLLSKSSGKSELLTIVEDDPVKLPDFGLIIVREDENGTGTKYLNLNTYDHYNRLISSKTEKSTAKYRYNAQGYRVEKTVNDNTTRYLYEADKVVLETDENNNQEAFQAYGSNLLYRTTAADDEMGAQSYYYLYNAHGDVTALIDAQGNIAVTYDYDAFGNILSESGTANNSIKYAGYQFDEESGLYYLNARYYDSVTARFITEDSYTGQKNDPLSLNLYTYCFNNPIIYTDPTGHATVSIVDYLKKQGEDSSYSSRKELAKELGIKNYSGTAAQNTQLLKTLQKQEKAERIAAENAAAKKAAEERIAAIKRAASASSVVKNTITDNDKNVKKKTSQVTNPSPTATPTNNVNKGTGNATNTVQENTFVFNPNGTIAVTGGVIAGEEVAKVVVSNPYVAATVILTGVFTLLWPAKEVNVGENEWIAERKKTHQNTEGADNSTVNSIPNKYPWNELPTTGEHPFEPKVDKSGNPVLKKGPKGEIIDKYGNEWTMDKQGAKVDNPHWDVTHKDGSHTNVNPESSENAGEVNHGKDNFK